MDYKYYCVITNYCPGEGSRYYVEVTPEEFTRLLSYENELASGLWPSDLSDFIVDDLLERDPVDVTTDAHECVRLSIC